MALPPERISVKRRREDPAIETFILEENRQIKKSRTNNAQPNQGFRFRLIKGGTIVPKSQQPTSAPASTVTTSPQPVQDSDGIPTVRSTVPGDEISDFVKFQHQQRAALVAEKDVSNSTKVSTEITSSPSNRSLPSISNARRFHLTRHLSSTYSAPALRHPSVAAGRGTTIRPPLPTFIERNDMQAKPQSQDINGANSGDVLEQQGSPTTSAQPSKSVPKTGVSLDDTVQTWNRDSDQLADELAALAMEMDPDLENSRAPTPPPVPKPVPVSPPPLPQPTTHDERSRREDEFIYETYMRIPVDATGDAMMIDVDVDIANVGVLVIDEEEEDLWQEYMESDEESEFDDEDSNGKCSLAFVLFWKADQTPAEDNPTNDYPDEEVSSDDEYNRNAYRYHRNDDTYDDEYDSD